ncbi:alpha/beta hydrolase [Bacillus piscicola]|uniref:alpha/beta hydrolase n=1 Tax=Bacillus piscicola TaxID=1632684 RepID=UPI001F09D617|nr:alpha/beta hydrolase [Bacillus piscicola]
MRKWILLAIGTVAVLLITVLLVAGNYLYGESVKRGTDVELYRGNEPASTSPKKESVKEKADTWFHSQKVKVLEQTSFDGLVLQANFIDNEKNKGKAVILAHGFRKQKEDMKKLAKFYYEHDFDILLPDARGHGDSEGDYIGYGWHDRLDYENWIKLLINKYEETDILLHGNSMGGSLVLMTSGEDLPDEVKGIIADSSYTTVKDELTHQLKHLYGLPAFPLLDVTSFITKVRAGYTFEEASAVAQVKKNTRPLFLIHGEGDELVPTDMASDLYEAANGEKSLWIVPDAGHIEAYDTAPKEFEQRLADFIQQTVANTQVK